MFVQSGFDPNVVGAHLLLGELLDLLDSTRSTVLETDAMKPLVEVDGVLAGHNLTHGGGLLFLGSHFVSL